MSSRPVYIPPAKRKSGNNSRPERFHGAFTGGFSAGYFNTVDTKEGWTPSNTKRKGQRLEDFMDEQDHEEWGGPTKVRQDYQTIAEENDSSVRPGPTNQTESLDTLLRISHQSVGPRLLRKLGWREEGKAAIVPMQDGETMDTKEGEDQEANILLSSKRLKKIRLQTHRFELPPPKLDECGLGFEPHEDAPEFKAFRERRKQRARERQTTAGSSNVYRASALTKDDEGNGLAGETNDKDGDDYLNYAETAEDFIGKKSVGGFAFRDDEDDAYDTTGNGRGGKPSREMLGDEYNTEIYEHQDSDSEDQGGVVTFDPSLEGLNDRGLVQRKTDLGSVLASWANAPKTATKGTSLMSNGKPPLAGFVLGGSINTHKKRYPGPDIPREYVVKRHVFGENEHPLIFQTIARAVKLQEKEQHLQRMNKKPLPPLAGTSNFVNLAHAMKSRFTTSKMEDKKTTERVGLYKPDPLVAKLGQVEDAAPAKLPTVKKPIVLKRTVQSFLPHPLLCKRFGVPVPKSAIGISMNASTISSNQPSRVTEASYFEKEVMSVRESEKLAKKEKVEKERNSRGDKKAETADLDMEQDPVGIQRPSMEKLKSIFAAESDSESSTDLDASSDEDEEKEGQPTEESLQRAREIVASAVGIASDKPPSETANSERKDGDDDKSISASSSASSSDSRHRERRRKRKSHQKHSSKRRKRSRLPDSEEDNDDGRRRRRKERRRKHDRKHRKKKSSRSKRER